jgi:hypothetical protein
MTKVLYAIIVVVFPINAVNAAELITTQSADVTSKDLPLKFVLEKTTWDRDDILIWGTVKNTGSAKYRIVKVIFTVRTPKGEFIGRKTWHVEPNEVGPRQVGYIEKKFVECEGRKPSKIEYSVIGEQ